MSLVATIDNGLDSLADALGRWTDQFNPILMKEVRQSLKSRQFLGTFLLMLLIAWIFSFAVTVISQYQSMPSRELLVAYLGVLLFCCGVVVPFTSYSSLSSERQQNTYELMQITLLKPSQIVWGKLWSALVQIGIYFSAITPFLGFTLLLEGVDVQFLLAALLEIFLFSLLLTMIGICQSSFNSTGVWRTLQTIGWLLFLLWIFFVVIMSNAEWAGTGVVRYAIISRKSLRTFEDWIILGIINAGLLFACGLLLNLLKAITVCQLTFPSDNRSTPVRRALIPIFFFWSLSLLSAQHSLTVLNNVNFYVFIVAGCYFLVTERDQLSARVLRDRWQYAPSGRTWLFTILTSLVAGAGLLYVLPAAPIRTAIQIGIVVGWITWQFSNRYFPGKRRVQIPLLLMPGGSSGVRFLMLANAAIPIGVFIVRQPMTGAYGSDTNFEAAYCYALYLQLFITSSYLMALFFHHIFPDQPNFARWVPLTIFLLLMFMSGVTALLDPRNGRSALVSLNPVIVIGGVVDDGFGPHVLDLWLVLVITVITTVSAIRLSRAAAANLRTQLATERDGTQRDVIKYCDFLEKQPSP